MTNKKTILIAEDEETIALSAKMKFEKAGYNTLYCGDGEECIAVLQNNHVDGVLLDLIMPKKTGFDVLAAMKDTDNKDAPVYVLTNLIGNDDAEKAKEMGAKRYFVKTQIKLKDVVNNIKEDVGE